LWTRRRSGWWTSRRGRAPGCPSIGDQRLRQCIKPVAAQLAACRHCSTLEFGRDLKFAILQHRGVHRSRQDGDYASRTCAGAVLGGVSCWLLRALHKQCKVSPEGNNHEVGRRPSWTTEGDRMALGDPAPRRRRQLVTAHTNAVLRVTYV
jgi:hypothetical protein